MVQQDGEKPLLFPFSFRSNQSRSRPDGICLPPPPGMWTRGERLFPAVLKRGKEVTAAWFQAQGGAWLHYGPGDVRGGVRL